MDSAVGNIDSEEDSLGLLPHFLKVSALIPPHCILSLFVSHSLLLWFFSPPSLFPCYLLFVIIATLIILAVIIIMAKRKHRGRSAETLARRRRQLLNEKNIEAELQLQKEQGQDQSHQPPQTLLSHRQHAPHTMQQQGFMRPQHTQPYQQFQKLIPFLRQAVSLVGQERRAVTERIAPFTAAARDIEPEEEELEKVLAEPDKLTAEGEEFLKLIRGI
ncbi:hypothetical protein F5Y08DRAFT_352493 [Xylaria arbuscula]|nr:hypothetical protein F5Y08DRAFT_352493 [Xylaria arbuscula]